MLIVIAIVAITSKVEANTMEKEKTFDLLFSEEIKINDLDDCKMFFMEQVEIEDISFTINTPDDIITIGYNTGADSFSYNDMVHDLQEVLNLRFEDKTLPEHYDIYSLPIERLSIKTTNLNVIEEELKTAFNYNDVHFKLKETISSYKENDSTIQLKEENVLGELLQNNDSKGKTIDGSYHYKKTSGHVSKTMWHSQSSGANTQCKRSAISPHEGDGNSRYDDGYQWYPNKVKADFTINKTTTPYVKNSTKLSYYFYKSALKNLQHDSNETLEMEVVFYDLPNETNPDDRGLTFQKTTGSVYLTNQPGAYLDTGLCDDYPCFCVGVKNANKLEAKKWYWWEITSKKGDYKGYPNDGRFRVNAQRGYRYLSDGAYGIFSEEHEKTVSYGKTSKQRWVPKTNAWKLANSGTTWTCNTSDGPIS